MNPEALRPIPTPFSQRLRHARMSVLPSLVFAVTIITLGVLWKKHVAAPSMVGQVEPVVANVSSHLPGVLAGLNVQRFQTVRAGDALGHVITADPKLLDASLAVVRSELEMLRANQDPIVSQQRNAVNFAQLRLDWMAQRVELASSRVELQGAEADFRRFDELFKSKIASETEVDFARTLRDSLREKVNELVKLLAETERDFKSLQPTNVADMMHISDEPMRAAIAAYDAQLRQVEAELSPVLLRAPTDGVVSAIFFRSGEAVTPGMPIVSIASTHATRIVGYLRPPLLDEPREGMKVEVRTRGLRRETGISQIVKVGAQLEVLPLVLQNPLKPIGSELGLTVDITLPPNFPARPGELVDVRILSDAAKTQ
jgi:multidrug resistance efflux pump